jgi:glyoxylase-like metal-dependent hydrolase (beta-lactamase superfamily II)
VTGTIDTPGVDGVFRIWHDGRSVYLLVRGEKAALIGAGGPGHLPLLRQALAMAGLKAEAIGAILLTHADPALCANAPLFKGADTRIYATALEAAKLSSGRFLKPGSTFREFLEGRRAEMLHFAPFSADILVADGDVLEAWYGLSVVALPGPTMGHCGYYCRHLGVLFAGTLFEQPGFFTRMLRPNSNRGLRLKSIAKADALHTRVILSSSE